MNNFSLYIKSENNPDYIRDYFLAYNYEQQYWILTRGTTPRGSSKPNTETLVYFINSTSWYNLDETEVKPEYGGHITDNAVWVSNLNKMVMHGAMGESIYPQNETWSLSVDSSFFSSASTTISSDVSSSESTIPSTISSDSLDQSSFESQISEIQNYDQQIQELISLKKFQISMSIIGGLLGIYVSLRRIRSKK